MERAMQGPGRWPGMDEARALLREWNLRHPDRWTPWEWLEEALLARRAWRLAVGGGRTLRTRARQRFREFSRRVPHELVELVMRGR